MSATASPLHYSEEELLSSGSFREPLFANGVRCHGGFDDEGRYCSPRVLFRNPAINAWQDQLRQGGDTLFEISHELIPPVHPNVAQAKLLLQNGVREPIVRALTIISIVEGFGARIRELPLPDFSSEVVEDLEGTCLAHLGKGLIEAHARDEAGHRDEGGHKQMWEAARDLGLSKPERPRYTFKADSLA